jgi:hypothetical protein
LIGVASSVNTVSWLIAAVAWHTMPLVDAPRDMAGERHIAFAIRAPVAAAGGPPSIPR